MELGAGRDASAPSWSDLRSRLISAVVLGLMSLGLLIVGGLPFRLLCCVSGLIVFAEWSRMTRANHAGPIFDFARRALYASLLAFLFGLNAISVGVLVLAGSFIALVDRGEHRADWVGGGLAYAALASLAPGMLRSDDLAGLAAMALVVCVVWPTDIFAYFVGRAIGGPKILPAVSPKKTVSGSIGGLLAGVAFGTGLYVLVAGSFNGFIVLFTAILSMFGQAGDFFESWVKRRFGVKDSGRLIPGHGGLMDRIDALVVAMGFAWLVGMIAAGFQHPAHAIFAFH